MYSLLLLSRSSRPEVFLRKVVLKICSKSTGEHPCRSVISINLLFNFIEIAFWHACSLKSHFRIGVALLNLQHIFRTPFPKNTSGRLLLYRSKILYIDKFLNHNLLKFKTLCLKVSVKKYVFAPVHVELIMICVFHEILCCFGKMDK